MNKFFDTKFFLKISSGKKRVIHRGIAEHMQNYGLSESSLSALTNETKYVRADAS